MSASWIPVNERLPSFQVMVLCYVPRSYNGANGVHYGWLNIEKNGRGAWREHSPHAYAHLIEDKMFTGMDNSKVTHWQPLPKPPAPAGQPGE